MCLAIPGRITAINDGIYTVKYPTPEVKIENSIIKNLKVGDWVIVQNKFIVQHLTDQQAQEFFKLLK